jgi:hypothetical protein
MANFRKIAIKLGLEDMGKTKFEEMIHDTCGQTLRFGKDKDNYIWSYCPRCQIKIMTILMPRFSFRIKLSSCND